MTALQAATDAVARTENGSHEEHITLKRWRTLALQAAADAFEKTMHGTQAEMEAFRKWRSLCETEKEEFEAATAYQRRQRATKAAAKKTARCKHRH